MFLAYSFSTEYLFQTHCDQFQPGRGWVVRCPAPSQLCLSTRGEFESVKLETRGCAPPTAVTHRSGQGIKISAVKRSIAFTIGFHNHGEGPP